MRPRRGEQPGAGYFPLRKMKGGIKNTGTGVPGNGARDKRKEKILRCGKEDISGVYMRERAYF